MTPDAMYEYREIDPLGDPTYTKEFFDFGDAYDEMLRRNPTMEIAETMADGDDRVVAQYSADGEEARILRRDL